MWRIEHISKVMTPNFPSPESYYTVRAQDLLKKLLDVHQANDSYGPVLLV